MESLCLLQSCVEPCKRFVPTIWTTHFQPRPPRVLYKLADHKNHPLDHRTKPAVRGRLKPKIIRYYQIPSHYTQHIVHQHPELKDQFVDLKLPDGQNPATIGNNQAFKGCSWSLARSCTAAQPRPSALGGRGIFFSVATNAGGYQQ